MLKKYDAINGFVMVMCETCLHRAHAAPIKCNVILWVFPSLFQSHGW